MESTVDKIGRLRASMASGELTEEGAVAALTEDGFTEVGARDVLNTPSEITSAQYAAAFRRDNAEYNRLRELKRRHRQG